MQSITSPLANLPGKTHNIVHTTADEKWVKAPNKPKHSVYITFTGGGTLHVVGNINAKSVYIGDDVEIAGSIAAEVDIRIKAGTEFVSRDEYPLVAGGNIVIGEPGMSSGSRSSFPNFKDTYILGGLLAGGDLFIGGGVELNTGQVIVGGDIILGATSSIQLYPIERNGEPLPMVPKYQCGGQIYLNSETHYRPFSIRGDNWDIIQPYSEDTPAVCLKNGASMQGGGERIPCANTTIYSEAYKTFRSIKLPAPNTTDTETYAAPVGLAPAYKAQAMVHRKATWLMRVAAEHSPFGVTVESLKDYVENNLADLLQELSLLALLEPDKFAESDVAREYEAEVLETIKTRDAYRRRTLPFATALVQSIADVDSKYFDELNTSNQKKKHGSRFCSFMDGLADMLDVFS